MSALVECVPNFSEGRRPEVIEAIADAIRSVEGVRLLDVDPGAATNRTVMTFVGPPEPVLEAAFAAIETAQRVIDMRVHQGEHARMGATDVCPLVPVSGIDMEACAQLAERLAERVGAELGIPVYLYERAARVAERANLATVRAGEYEGLRAKLARPGWAPDAGPGAWSESIARSGATVIGARPFLIAWNINLNTRNKRLAMKIAAELRTRGKLKREPDGTIVRGADGRALRVPGRFQALKGVGWYIDEYRRAQLSFNLTDFRQTSLQAVFDAACEVADSIGIRVTGSELVGLVPRDALIEAGLHYLHRQGICQGVSESELLEVAIQSLGLSELAPFDPGQRIIEYRIAAPTPLASLSVADFVDTTASDAPAPGGGSVAALAGSLGAALAAMVGNLTVNRKFPGPHRDALEVVALRGQALKAQLLAAVDEDTHAFDRILAARRLPRQSEAQKAARAAAIQRATLGAIEVPLGVLAGCVEVMELGLQVARQGMRSCLSDGGVAAWMAAAGAEGAWLNVRINLPDLADARRRAALRARADDLIARARSLRSSIPDAMAGVS